MNDIISSLGAGSGINTSGLVSQLVEVERAPTENRLNSRETKLEAQISAYGTLKSAFSEFQSLLAPLANNDTFQARSVAIPDTDILTANSLAPGAQAGTYQIEVKDIAQAQSLAMGTTTDAQAAIGIAGTLDIRFGEWTYTDIPPTFAQNGDKDALSIVVTATDTLESLADKINDNDQGLQASVLNVDGQYQLLITTPSGASNAVEITSTGDAGLSAFEFTGESTVDVTETQQGADAWIKVNGLDVYREQNEIDDVIQGFNFTLNKSSTEKLTFTVEADSDVPKQAVRDFIDGYNTLFATLNNLTGYSEDEDNNRVRGDLATDGSAKALISQLRSMISLPVGGIDTSFNTLSAVGVKTNLDGTLGIDDEQFNTAFSDNFEKVEALFARTAQSANPYVDVGVGSAVRSATSGSYAVQVTTDPSSGSATGNSIALAGLVFPFTATTDHNFKVQVDGVETETLTLSGTFGSGEELAAALQSLINGDPNISETGARVDVSFDGDVFIFESRSFGDSSKVSFTEFGLSIADLGIEAGLTETIGVDVAGTIDGVAGFGTGEVLLPDLDSNAYGLNFTVREGAAAVGASTFDFSRGFAGELNRMISDFLANSGPISSRESSLRDQLDDVSDDRERLERRMEAYEERISAQFLAMEQIISSLNTTGSALDGILDRLPFTAAKN